LQGQVDEQESRIRELETENAKFKAHAGALETNTAREWSDSLRRQAFAHARQGRARLQLSTSARKALPLPSQAQTALPITTAVRREMERKQDLDAKHSTPPERITKVVREQLRANLDVLGKLPPVAEPAPAVPPHLTAPAYRRSPVSSSPFDEGPASRIRHGRRLLSARTSDVDTALPASLRSALYRRVLRERLRMPAPTLNSVMSMAPHAPVRVAPAQSTHQPISTCQEESAEPPRGPESREGTEPGPQGGALLEEGPPVALQITQGIGLLEPHALPEPRGFQRWLRSAPLRDQGDLVLHSTRLHLPSSSSSTSAGLSPPSLGDLTQPRRLLPIQGAVVTVAARDHSCSSAPYAASPRSSAAIEPSPTRPSARCVAAARAPPVLPSSPTPVFCRERLQLPPRDAPLEAHLVNASRKPPRRATVAPPNAPRATFTLPPPPPPAQHLPIGRTAPTYSPSARSPRSPACLPPQFHTERVQLPPSIVPDRSAATTLTAVTQSAPDRAASSSCTATSVPAPWRRSSQAAAPSPDLSAPYSSHTQ